MGLQLDELQSLGTAIRDGHRRVRGHGLNFYAASLEVGEKLRQAKKVVPHGQWADWVEQTCDVKPRQARRYMTLARSGTTAEGIVEAGGIRALLMATASKTAPGSVLPGEDAEPNAPEPPDTAEAEAVLAAAEGQWEGNTPGNTPEPPEADTEPARKRKPNRAKVQPEAGPLTRMEKLEAENAQLQGQVEALESLLKACREGREVAGTSLGPLPRAGMRAWEWPEPPPRIPARGETALDA